MSQGNCAAAGQAEVGAARAEEANHRAAAATALPPAVHLPAAADTVRLPGSNRSNRKAATARRRVGLRKAATALLRAGSLRAATVLLRAGNLRAATVLLRAGNLRAATALLPAAVATALRRAPARLRADRAGAPLRAAATARR